jgi:transglutaminase-like putative cysteine protease
MQDVAPEFREPNADVDSDHPAVRAYARSHGVGSTPRERAVSLYYAVRDGFRYSPWNVRFQRSAFRASDALARGAHEGLHCIDKANILAACARAIGIPSRLHFANVRNHVGTASLEEKLGTDLLVFHGYTELYLGGRWVAATPAFNRELCDKLGVAPLEWDGETDAIFQAYDREAGRFMEYVADHGAFAAIPFDQMIAAFRVHYPVLPERWRTD